MPQAEGDETFHVEELARFAVPDHVLARHATNEIVLLNLESEHYFGLDGVAGRFWELAPQSTFSEVVDTLLTEFEVDRERLVEDLQALIDDLRIHHLIDVVAP